MMTFISLLALPLLAAVVGYALGLAAQYLKVEGDPLAEQIGALLPNGQCGQCGYPGCAQAAEAMARGEAPPTCCPPGGQALAKQLAALLGVSLDASSQKLPQLATIDESACDGCGRCFKQCPFDAIVGATRQLHGVIPDACTGCGQCLSACPHSGIRLYDDPLFALAAPKPGTQGVRHA